MSLQLQQENLAEEAVQYILKYHGYTDEEANSSFQNNNTPTKGAREDEDPLTDEHLTPPHNISIYRAHCVDLSYNDNYDDELYLAQQKIKNLEKALRLAKQKIGDLWMELYNERSARNDLEEKISKIAFV
jgi:hypothetical protein